MDETGGVTLTARTSSPPVTYDDAVHRYEPVLGMETHVELSTASKMWCGCSTRFGDEPNTNTCPVCLALPGALPVANAEAVRATVLIGLALHCGIAERCRFARKNYFYPDMPKNFQISQYDEPLCTDGYLDVPVDGTTVRVEVERVHLEEDTGKTLHVGGATGRIHGATHSLVDYNRAGIPLVEIVSRPVTGTGERVAAVARAYASTLRDVVAGLGVSDVRMEQGSLRCDVNVSLAPSGAPWGTRTETKNVNSFRSVERAVRAEVERQAALLDAGERVVMETRHFDEQSATSRPGRSKETAEDYRYFPEPDLVPLAPDPGWVAELRASLPEEPQQRRDRLAAELAASPGELDAMANAGVLDLVVATAHAGAPPDQARAWWLSYLAERANGAGVAPADLGVTPAQVARVVALVASGDLTNKLARTVVDLVLDAPEPSSADVDALVAEHDLRVVSDESALSGAVAAAVQAQPGPAQKVRDGNEKAVGPLVGAVMRETGGAADAATVRRLLLEHLTG